MGALAKLLEPLRHLIRMPRPPRPKAYFYLAEDGTIQVSDPDQFQPSPRPIAGREPSPWT